MNTDDSTQVVPPAESWTLGGTRLLYQHCAGCAHRWYFLRTFCPRCGREVPRTLAASGLGRVVATTLVHRAPSDTFRSIAPYALVLVDADEGFRLMAHADPVAAIGDRVTGGTRTIAGRVLSKDPAADAFLVGIAVAGAGYDGATFAADTAGFAAATGKPLVVAAPQPSVGEAFKAHALPVFPTEAEAVRALGQFLSHAQLLEKARAHPPGIPSRPRAAGAAQMLDEAASLALLERAGVPVARHLVCADTAEAVAAWAWLGRGAVVVKGCTVDASHKTELGLVRVGPDSEAAVAQACEAMTAAAAAAGVALTGVIVAELVRGRRELLIGARLDPVFGPVVLVGDGGKYVEAMPDAQVLLPPFGAPQVEQALRRLRIARLLDGVRGEPPLDVAAFSACAVAVGRLMLDAAAGITQLDVNPVIVRARGEGCAAVDAVIYRQTQTETKGTR